MFEGEGIRISIRGSITDSQDVLEVTTDISELPLNEIFTMEYFITLIFVYVFNDLVDKLVGLSLYFFFFLFCKKLVSVCDVRCRTASQCSYNKNLFL